MLRPKPTLKVIFYAESSGNEPVRKWLKSLDSNTRLIIGTDIKKVQFRWPLGLPLIRNLGEKLWEVRTTLPNRIARVIFTICRNEMIFIKKTQKTPSQDLKIAKERAIKHEDEYE